VYHKIRILALSLAVFVLAAFTGCSKDPKPTSTTTATTIPTNAIADSSLDQIKASVTIHPELDGKNRASSTIDEKGGVLQTTDAQGIIYELNIPPNALLSPEKITMTPVQSVPDLPMSGGLKGAVNLEPDGLLFNENVELTLTFPSAITLGEGQELAGFSYRGQGEKLERYPAIELIGENQLQIKLFHFSGYGAGGAASSDASGIPSTGIVEVILDRTIPPEQKTEFFRKEYNSKVLPALEAAVANPDLLEDAFTETFGFFRQLALFGMDGELEEEWQQVKDLIGKILKAAIELAQSRCFNEKDISQVYKMLKITRIALLMGYLEHDRNLQELLGGCLRFKVDWKADMKDIDWKDEHFNYVLEGHGILDQLEYYRSIALSGDLEYEFTKYVNKTYHYADHALIGWTELKTVLNSKQHHLLFFNLNYKEDNDLGIVFVSDDVPKDISLAKNPFDSDVFEIPGFFHMFFHVFFSSDLKSSHPDYDWHHLTDFSPGEGDIYARLDQTITANIFDPEKGSLHLVIELRHVPLPPDQY